MHKFDAPVSVPKMTAELLKVCHLQPTLLRDCKHVAHVSLNTNLQVETVCWQEMYLP